MLSHLYELCRTNSVKFITISSVFLYILLGVLANITFKDPSKILKNSSFGTDIIPIFLAILGVVAITGVTSRGAIVYDLLINPNRIKVYMERSLAVATISAISMIMAWFISFIASVIIMKLSIGSGIFQLDMTEGLEKIISLLFLSIVFSILGTSIGFLVKSSGAGIFLLLGILWGLPLLTASIGIFNSNISSFLTKLTPTYFGSTLVEADGKWIVGVLGLMLWLVITNMIGFLKFRKYVP